MPLIFYSLSGAAALPSYNVIWLINQSNALGWAFGTEGIDRVWPTGTKQWGRVAPNAGTLVSPYVTSGDPLALEHDGTAVAPLRGVTASVGLALARIYYAQVDSSRPILIVPSASGATGFVDDRWNPG